MISTRTSFGGATFAAFVFFFLAASPLSADSVYTYNGNDFATYYGSTCPKECNLSGDFTVASPLGDDFSGAVTPDTFDFTDGQNTFTNANSNDDGFYIQTDAEGNIDEWGIALYNYVSNQWYVSCDNSASTACETYGVDAKTQDYEYNETYFAYNVNDPGTWSTGSSGTPEPGTLSLFGIGLIGWAAFRRRAAIQSR